MKQISVVIVTLAGRRYLERCLKALRNQRNFDEIEIIVPYDDQLSGGNDLQKDFAEVHFLKLNGKRTYAELRSAGFQMASSPIVALTEDQCIPDPDWCLNILQSHATAHAAVGGAVDKGFDSTQSSDNSLSWSIYFCDYSRYANPIGEGFTNHLTDCNVSYKREALQSIAPLWQQEFHETVVHRALQKSGETLWLSQRIIVEQQRRIPFLQAIRERYIFGRLFGCTRVANAPLQRRAFYAFASFLLPLLLTLRIAKNVFVKKRYRVSFFRCLPLIILLNLFWSFGEFLGYLTANPDSSLSPQQVSA